MLDVFFTCAHTREKKPSHSDSHCMRRLFLLTIVYCTIHLALPVSADPPKIHLGADIIESFYLQNGYLDRGVLESGDEMYFSKDLAFNWIGIYPSLSISLADNVDVVVLGDFTVEHHFDDVFDDCIDLDFAAAYASFSNNWFRLVAGILPVNFGDGRILTDEAPAVEIRADSAHGYLDFTMARVWDQWPTVGVTLGYEPGFFEHISLFGLWFHEEDDHFIQSLPLIQQILLDAESESDLFWVGTTANLFIGPAFLSMIGAYQFGQVRTANRFRTNEFDISAYFLDLGIGINWSSTWSMEAFCVVASGDDTPVSGDLTVFTSVQSFNPRAAIFFDPEFFDYDSEYQLTIGAGTFGGVIAPGLSMTRVISKNLTIEAAAANFYAHKGLAGDSNWYGWEADLDVSYSLFSAYTLYARLARFWHGDYFASLLDESIDPATQLVVGISAAF